MTRKCKRNRQINILVSLLIIVLLFSGCSKIGKEGKDDRKNKSTEKADPDSNEPGEKKEQENPDYEIKNISMKQEEKEAVSKKLLSAVEKCRDIYSRAETGETLNIVLDDTVVHQMIDRLAYEGYSIICGDDDYNMQNYEMVNKKLQRAKEGGEVETEFYMINTSGVFSYSHLDFVDNELVVTYVSAMFDDNMEPQINYMDKVKVYQWEYTEKGWLIWEKALSRNQEMDMHVFHRILPLEDKCREIAKKCIVPVSYLSNNLFLTDWDMDHLDQIEFNDLFDFLYSMKTGNKIDSAKYSEGIPREEFESTVQTYFDITAEELREYANYNENKGVYPWNAIGPWNRVQQFQPFPEVVKCVENEDGTWSVYVEAVFVELGMDCSFSHIVTIREDENGGWVYCGNEVNWDDAYHVQGYKARREYKNI